MTGAREGGRARRAPPTTIALRAEVELRDVATGLSIELSLSPRVSGPIDEARVRGELSFILRAAAFEAPQDVASALASWLLVDPGEAAGRPALEHVEVRVESAQGDRLAAWSRAAAELEIVTEVKDFGFVDVIWENGRSGLYRERIHPRTVLPTHVHHHLSEMELVLDAALLAQGRPARPGTAFAWPKRHPHRWENPTDRHQAFLCIDRPAFIPTDEVEVDVPTERLTFSASSRFF